MAARTAAFEANVLNSYPLMGVLPELAEARIYRSIWSTDIHDEWTRNPRAKRPNLESENIISRRQAKPTTLPDACMTGHRRLNRWPRPACPGRSTGLCSRYPRTGAGDSRLQ